MGDLEIFPVWKNIFIDFFFQIHRQDEMEDIDNRVDRFVKNDQMHFME